MNELGRPDAETFKDNSEHFFSVCFYIIISADHMDSSSREMPALLSDYIIELNNCNTTVMQRMCGGVSVRVVNTCGIELVYVL